MAAKQLGRLEFKYLIDETTVARAESLGLTAILFGPRCRSCKAAAGFAALTLDCEGFDNGLADSSCLTATPMATPTATPTAAPTATPTTTPTAAPTATP